MTQITQKKNGALIVIAAFLFAIIAVHFDYALTLYLPQEKKTLDSQEIEESQPEEDQKELVQDLSKFRSDAKTVEVVVSNDYEAEETIEGDKTEILPQNITHAQVENKENTNSKYFSSLSSVSKVLLQFIQKINYIDELRSIDQKNLPQAVKHILSDMEKFAEKHLSNNVERQVFPGEGFIDKMIGHLVQIKEMPSYSPQMNKDYELILNKLYIVEGYFYSPEFFNDARMHD